MNKRTALGLGGLLAGMLLAAPPVWAQAQQQGQTQTQGQRQDLGAGGNAQAAPSIKPVPKERTGRVAPFTAGAVPNPGAKAVGTAEAAPSQLPAPKATPEAIDAHQGKWGRHHARRKGKNRHVAAAAGNR
jgi:hypothetical protein